MVGLDLAHRGQHRPGQSRAASGGLPVEGEIAGRDVGAGSVAGRRLPGWSSRPARLGGDRGIQQAQVLGHPESGHRQDEQAHQDQAAAQPKGGQQPQRHQRQPDGQGHRHHRRTTASGLTGRPPPGWIWKSRWGGPPLALPVAPTRAIGWPAWTCWPRWTKLCWLWA